MLGYCFMLYNEKILIKEVVLCTTEKSRPTRRKES